MDTNIPSASKGSISVMKEVALEPVSPCDHGEGFPYAPVDWPNAGDVWGWKVGNRFNSSGFFTDRMLLVPKRYQPSHEKRCLPSKPSVIRYLQSQHPNANIDAFFASFSWEIPVKRQFVKKVKDTPRPQKFSKLEARKVVGGGSQGKMTRKQVLHGQQTRRSSRLLAQFAKSRSRTCTNTVIDLCSDNDGTSMGDQTTSDSNSSQINSIESDNSKYPASSSTATSHSRDRLAVEEIIEDLDDNINSLDGILAQPPQGVRFSLPPAELTLDMAQARKKLSEKTKKVEANADKFFADLEANITLATNLESEYNESRKEAACLEAEINSVLLKVEEFNEQITILQSQSAQARNILKKTRRKMSRVRSKQEVVAGRLSNVVQEVEMAQSERPKWLLKKETGAYQEASIVEKFAPLEGFSFCKPLKITFVDKID